MRASFPPAARKCFLRSFEYKVHIDGHLIAEVHSYAPYPFAFDVAGDSYWGPYDKKVFDEAHMRQNADVDFVITDADMELLKAVAPA